MMLLLMFVVCGASLCSVFRKQVDRSVGNACCPVVKVLMSSPGTLFFWLLIRTMALRPYFGRKRGNLLYLLTEQDTSGIAGESEWQLQCTGINQDD